jgi:hypothetical protein
MLGGGVRFHLMAQALGVLLQLAAHGFKRVGHGHIHVAMPAGAFGGLAHRGRAFPTMADHEFPAGDADVDPHMKSFAMQVVAVRRLDHDPAARNAIEILLEPSCLHFDTQGNCLRWIHVSERSLDGCIHKGLRKGAVALVEGQALLIGESGGMAGCTGISFCFNRPGDLLPGSPIIAQDYPSVALVLAAKSGW